MVILKLYPTGTLEYDDREIRTSGINNKAVIPFGNIISIEFNEPSFFKNGIIKIKAANINREIYCIFRKKRLADAKIAYSEIMELKNKYAPLETMTVNNLEDFAAPITVNNLEDFAAPITVHNMEDFDTPITVQTATSDEDTFVIKYCPECGTKVEVANSKFCKNCGERLTLKNQENAEIVENIQEEVKQENVSDNEELDELITREEEQFSKMSDKEYYFSEESKIKGKQVYEDKKQYLIDHPDDFDRKGASIFSILWSAIDTIPPEERKIFTLTGKGKYIEEQGDYEEAIKVYEEADALTLKVCANEIQELTEEYGEGDYLYCAKIRQRIRVCNNNILKEKTKKLEEEAKELEKTNPQKAIEIYNQLNELKPGLKKYNKRIEICEKRI